MLADERFEYDYVLERLTDLCQTRSIGHSLDGGFRINVEEQLAQEVREKLHQAELRVDEFRRDVERGSLAACQSTLHSHRRRVAGFYQVGQLIARGETALRTAIDDGLLIFQGHRVNCAQFRRIYGW
ncbi:hypothetical protein FA95DRAFT_1503685 [Auriscalpium vulgare]|uniref:Uncharacterized protein n=1 Tax=Auriscalpium vulgare TaxID=40419 RepID=A0ACB8R793_9AGAM|nr:hypothetical protein FA95DRAFT_1503685 [Auriscalpium vulgare]